MWRRTFSWSLVSCISATMSTARSICSLASASASSSAAPLICSFASAIYEHAGMSFQTREHTSLGFQLSSALNLLLRLCSCER